MLGLRPPGLEFRILCLEDSVISIISPSSGGSPGPGENTSKLAIYSTFEREFEPERYLNFKIIKSHGQALSRLSCSSPMLQIQTGRHKNMLIAD